MMQNIVRKLRCINTTILTRITFRQLMPSSHHIRAFSKNTNESATATKVTNMDDEQVLLKEVGDCGIILLNRPKTLNSVNVAMIRKIDSALKQWESSKRLVLIEGSGDKAFCAGGDVKVLISILNESGKEFVGKEFFFREYSLNHYIATFKKPYIAFMNGITMGGGVGLSVHGKYRVATEKTIFAMPETAIGHFPDVGTTYVLSRMKKKLGLYLGLTGHRLKGIDVLLTGIATHYVPSDKLPELKHELLTSQDDVDKILNKYQPKLYHEFSLAPHILQIENCFTAQSVEEIIEKLKKDNSNWAQKTVETLLKMAPSSLKITKKAIDEGIKKSLAECLQVEYRLACSAMAKDVDFYEGVKALLVDKGRKPVWNPASLKDVTDEYINKRFAALSNEKELELQ